MPIIPQCLKIGDTIGVVAPSDPIVGNNIEELKNAKKIVEKSGFNVKFSNHIYANTNGYSSTPQEKAEDINEMFQDKEVKMIWCAKGGNNSNTVFEYLDYETIKQNPKILCGYSDITSISNIITAKTGLVTFYGTNFKTIATDETDYSYQEALKRFVKADLTMGRKKEAYRVFQEGQAEGTLMGGNLNLIHSLVSGKYQLDFHDKILFIEDLGLESNPAMVSHFIAHMKQNEIFSQIKGIWIGNYEHESNITLEQILFDIIGKNPPFPVIQSNNFGHIETKTVIPIGIKAKIDTNQSKKIELIEPCVK